MASTVVDNTAEQEVAGGVDSHTDTLHVAVISDNGGHLADAEFTTTAAGYAAALAFLSAHGHVIAIGVEGTSSYGAGFTRAAREAGLHAVEVNRPDRAERPASASPTPSTPTPQPAPPCPDEPTPHPRTTQSRAYAPCTTPPAPPSRPAPQP
jgi:hypothetical protein